MKKNCPKAKNKPDIDLALMAKCAMQITAQDCAAYSVLMFQRTDCPEEWKELGVRSFAKFAEFGWAAFHGLGGLSFDWGKAVKKLSEM